MRGKRLGKQQYLATLGDGRVYQLATKTEGFERWADVRGEFELPESCRIEMDSRGVGKRVFREILGLGRSCFVCHERSWS